MICQLYQIQQYEYFIMNILCAVSDEIPQIGDETIHFQEGYWHLCIFSYGSNPKQHKKLIATGSNFRYYALPQFHLNMDNLEVMDSSYGGSTQISDYFLSNGIMTTCKIDDLLPVVVKHLKLDNINHLNNLKIPLYIEFNSEEELHKRNINNLTIAYSDKYPNGLLFTKKYEKI